MVKEFVGRQLQPRHAASAEARHVGAEASDLRDTGYGIRVNKIQTSSGRINSWSSRIGRSGQIGVGGHTQKRPKSLQAP